VGPLERRFSDPRIIENDALVVLCIHSLAEALTHHDLKVRVRELGWELSDSAVHNMLHRATGRVMLYPDKKWRITVQGWTYREHVLATLAKLLTTARRGLEESA
jgi:hypothetical protein